MSERFYKKIKSKHKKFKELKNLVKEPIEKKITMFDKQKKRNKKRKKIRRGKTSREN